MDLNGTTIHFFFAFFLLTTFHKCAERKGIGNTHTFAHRGVRGVLLLSPDNLKWRLLKEVKEAKNDIFFFSPVMLLSPLL